MSKKMDDGQFRGVAVAKTFVSLIRDGAVVVIEAIKAKRYNKARTARRFLEHGSLRLNPLSCAKVVYEDGFED